MEVEKYYKAAVLVSHIQECKKILDDLFIMEEQPNGSIKWWLTINDKTMSAHTLPLILLPSLRSATEKSLAYYQKELEAL